MNENMNMHDKMRIIQEIVPGRQITLAHIIANPDESLCRQVGLSAKGEGGAIGIVTVTPAETAIILGDVAIKASGVSIGFADRVSGSLAVTGTVSEVEAALSALSDYAEQKLKFEVCGITKT